MAIPFKEPSPRLVFNSPSEIDALQQHFIDRKVSVSSPNNLLLASWNIANLGVQDRQQAALDMIAHILSQFDLIAIQEINDDFRQFTSIVQSMGERFTFVMSDTAGNNERLAFVYNKEKVNLGKLFGEVALRPREYPKRSVKVNYRKGGKNRTQTFKDMKFTPFDRNPFIGSFAAGKIDLVLANVHLYFGAFQNSTSVQDRRKYARRVLEIYALAKWAKHQSARGNAWDEDIVLLGDMNVPNMEQNEATLAALQQFAWRSVDLYKDNGLAQVESLTRVGGSNLGNDKTYDQIAFAPTSLRDRVVSYGVFDFDAVVFSGKWNELAENNTHLKTVKKFSPYVRYYLSDHRPVWVELRTD